MSQNGSTEPHRSFACDWPWVTLGLSALALALPLFPNADRVCVYDRTAIHSGEYWRLWTGQFVHFGWPHLWWNLMVFLPAGLWAERLVPGRFRLFLGAAPLAIGVALYGLNPSLSRYAGLSGMAAGVLTFLSLVQLRRGRSDLWFWRAVLIMIAAKIAYEFALSQPLFVRFNHSEIRTVPLAHVSGALLALFAQIRLRLEK